VITLGSDTNIIFAIGENSDGTYVHHSDRGFRTLKFELPRIIFLFFDYYYYFFFFVIMKIRNKSIKPLLHQPQHLDQLQPQPQLPHQQILKFQLLLLQLHRHLLAHLRMLLLNHPILLLSLESLQLLVL